MNMTTEAYVRLKNAVLVGMAIAAVLWVYIDLNTYNSYDFFGHEFLSTVFDAQAQSFLHGRVDVDKSQLGLEFFDRNGKTYIYWGPWPAMIRMPLLFLKPRTFGAWARLSCLIAALLTVAGWGAVVYRRLRGRSATLFALLLVSTAAGTPIVWLISSSVVYHETILWGLAASAWCLFFALAFDQNKTVANALGFSGALFVAFLSRSTYAFPWLIVTAWFLYSWLKQRGAAQPNGRAVLAALIVPIAAAVLFQGFLNYQRFGNPLVFIDLMNYRDRDPVRTAVIQNSGYSNYRRLPDVFSAYFVPHTGYFSTRFPFIRPAVVRPSRPELFFLYPESTIALTVVSPWLFFLAFYGMRRLWRFKAMSNWAIAGSLSLQALSSLTIWMIVMRYSLEALPFLMSLAVFALGADSRLVERFRASGGFRSAVVALCGFSIYASLASAISWTSEYNRGTSPHHQAIVQQRFREIDRTIRHLVDTVIR